MRELPNYVTVVLDKKVALKDADGNVVKDEKGETVMVNVEEIISDVNIVCERATGDQNASVLIGTQNYNFTITFEDETITLDTLELNAYDYQDTLNAMEEAGTIRVKVNDSFYRNLPAEFNGWKDTRGVNVKELDRSVAQIQSTYFVNVKVGVGTIYEQEMTLPIEFKPFDIYYIERNGLNYIETDFIEYAYGESFPEEITVVGWDGDEFRKYTARAKWNTKAVTVDLKGGQYFASAIINEGDYNQWTLEGIEVRVKSSEITGLARSNRSVVFDWKYYLYGKIDADRCIPSLLKYMTKDEDDPIKENVPSTIDISGILDNLDYYWERSLQGLESELNCPVSIDAEIEDDDGNYKSVYSTTIKVIIPSVKMSLIEDVIEIDVSNEETFRGLDLFFRSRSKMEIMLGNDTVTANVTWNTEDVIVSKDGTYDATVTLGSGAFKQTCTVKVVIFGNPEPTQPEESTEGVQ